MLEDNHSLGLNQRHCIAPLVSICCIAFNQENYIEQTINGFLAQKTDFSCEIIIHDDASTDNTQKIIQKYADRHPDLILPILQSENQYSKGVKPFTNIVIPKARGKYIAICEGDDYWTDPFKLQKQVDFLEKNPDFGMVHTNHSAFLQNSGTTRISHKKKYQRNIPSGDIFFDLLHNNFISTLTVLVSRKIYLQAIHSLHSWIDKNLLIDYTYWLEISRLTKIKYLDIDTAVYRISEGSVSNPTDEYAKSLFDKKVYDIVNSFCSHYDLHPKLFEDYSQNFFSNYLNTRYKYSDYYRFNLEISNYRPNTHKERILLYLFSHSFPKSFFQAVEFPSWIMRKFFPK